MNNSFRRWTVGEDITIEARMDRILVDIPFAMIRDRATDVAQRDELRQQCDALGRLDAEYQHQRRKLYEAMRAQVAEAARDFADRWGLSMREWGHEDDEK